jgi:hypothetical protein
VREKLFTTRWLATLAVSACALASLASPAYAPGYVAPPPSRSSICFSGQLADEDVARAMHLEPASGATVPAGTPITFSGESNHVLTFSVASSEALLSSPDIDSGTGSQSGAFSRFTSAKATATPRTIYWTASFTLTPEDCESPSTFTTPVHTLLVVPSEAELAAAKRQQEEAAAKKRSEEEAATKKKREEEAAAPTGSVLFVWSVGPGIKVQSGAAGFKVTCRGTATCSGKLTLMVKIPFKKGKKTKTTTIGTTTFSVPPGNTVTIELNLNTAGRSLLKADRGRLTADLTILKSSPPPVQTKIDHSVHLVQQKAHGKATK